MEIRNTSRVKRNSPEADIIRKLILDLYVITENATACYDLYRRAMTGEDTKILRSNASTFFKKEENVVYIEARRAELAQWGFNLYAKIHRLDTTNIQKKTDKYADIENLTPDELRTKNLSELEDIKNFTQDENLKAQIIKQQTELMDAKRKGEQEQNTTKFIHYYLPMPYCNGCPQKPNKKNNSNNK